MINIISWLIRKIILSIIILIILYGAVYFYMHADSEREKVFDRYYDAIVRNLDIKNPEDILFIFDNKTPVDILKNTLNDASYKGETLESQRVVPPELRPINNVLKGYDNYNRVKHLFTEAYAGEKGERSVPVLAKLLKSDDVDIRLAARESLELIGNVDALIAIRNKRK